ncbi:hypothetical protein P3X46_026421 [Hevea brasiliensis]|uniref:TF-B3 domain-containing protein n=1 Tax=Hevea brasiliensis TaxID=3981 RepID=A0ABQ9KWK0_HEVBR|nr:B3 domain-containing transcription factor VRN1 isoform X1 [Hevea brasiliensis]KAJ9152913.1 hypothetical protein P3X46_026421 [Hevea brasiliensis]
MASRHSMRSCERPCCRQSTTRVKRYWRSFFSKIRASTIEDKKLKLPVKFVRKYGDELSDVAKLIAPNGLIWEVGLTKGAMIIWFDDGWHEFVEYYSICNGWILIFNYMGMSSFNVSIFDESVFEIGYPCYQPRSKEEPRKQPLFNEDEMKHNDFGGILGSNPHPSSSKGASSKKRNYATTQQNLARPVFGSGNLGINKSFKDAASAEKRKFQQEYQKKGDNCEMEDLPNANDSNLGCEEFNIFTSKQFYATLSKISPESKKAVDAAMECKPKNPAFLVILRQHFVGDNAMHVPSAFAKSFLRNISEMIKVQDSNGGEWIIHTDCYWRGGYLSLRGGWAEFFSDNELVVGDVCLFELIRKKNVALKVSVFHAFMD